MEGVVDEEKCQHQHYEHCYLIFDWIRMVHLLLFLPSRVSPQVNILKELR